MNQRETDFEKARGVSRVEVRNGFAQVHIGGLGEPLADERLRALRAVASQSVSIDFLKLTPGGLSFLIPGDRTDAVATALGPVVPSLRVETDRSIVLVHAVNMRDEEGLLARIVEGAIRAGATIDHLGDMHDRMLLVLPTPAAERLAEEYRDRFLGAEIAG